MTQHNVLKGVSVAGDSVQLGRPSLRGTDARQVHTQAQGSSVQSPFAEIPTPTSSVVTDGGTFARAEYDRGIAEGRRQASLGLQAQIEKEAKELAKGLAQELAEELTKQKVREAVEKIEKDLQEQTGALQASLSQQRDLFASAASNLAHAHKQMVAMAEDDMLALAHAVVCRILGESGTSREGMRAILKSALQGWQGRHVLSVHLHPDDLAVIQEDLLSQGLLLASGFSEAEGSLKWVSDAQVVVGGLLLRSADGALDSRLEVQLQALKTSLLKTRETRRVNAAESRTSEAAP